MDKTILIGGGSGLIGSRLTALLLQKGYQVRHLGRRAKDGRVRGFAWDVSAGKIDEAAFDGVSVVINLAGANISGSRWTDKYKQELLHSRVRSTKLIVDFLNRGNHQVEHFVQGSAIGYYGFGDASNIFKEEDQPGTDFLSQLVKVWENSAQLSSDANKRTRLSIVRTGIALSRDGGALVEMARPVRLFVGAPLGTGRQIVSWIHIDDLCGMIIYIIERKLEGNFNGVAPQPASNKQMTEALARVLGRPLWLPNIPGFVLKLVLGEMSSSVLNGSYVSSEKIERAGFIFRFEKVDQAIAQLYMDRE